MKSEVFKHKNLGYPYGYIISFLTFLTSFPSLFVIWKFQLKGFIILNFFRYAVFYLEAMTSNALEYNKMILKKNGYDPEKIIKSELVKSFVRNIINFTIYSYYFKDVKVHHDLTLLWRIVLTLLVTEIYFTISHKVLHRYYPDLHRMHHCCLRPSFTSNLIFGNMDLFVEFTIPTIISFVMNIFVFDDPYSLMWSTGLIITWYIMDHDEYLQLPHWKHHQYIDSNFSVYVKYKDFDNKDQVKQMIKRF